ncbi:MAG: FUSC family protein [Ktedonobacteraceae bacterium]
MKLARSCKYTRLGGRLRKPKLPPVHVTIPRQTRLRLHNAWEILRANLTLRSAASRHALRLGLTLALATALYRIFPMLVQRGYWIPLTALLVLKPDFRTTFARGVARLVGTMLGAVLTTLLVAVLAPTQELLVILDAIMAYLAFSFLYANYAIFSAFITMETVFLLTFVVPQPLETVTYRAIDTAIGGILALLIYALWPTWERSQVPGNIANRIEALRRYFVAVMDAYAHPEAYDALAIHDRLRESRLARSNAEASVERSLQEPEPHRIDPDLALGLLGAADNIARSVLALEAYLLDNPSRHAIPQITTFTAKVDESLRLLATAIREERPVTALPNLEEALRTLEQAEKSGNRTRNEASTDLRFVISEAKHIIRSINAMGV